MEEELTLEAMSEDEDVEVLDAGPELESWFKGTRDLPAVPLSELSWDDVLEMAKQANLDPKFIDEQVRVAKGRGGPLARRVLIKALMDVR